MSYILKTVNLTKAFKGREAVSSVNIHIKKGEIYGFLGPNGSGKTTLMRMAANLIKPTEGEIEIFGDKLTDKSYEVLKRMGTIIETPVFYEKLTARENLELHCEYMGYYDKGAVDKAFELVNLKDIEKKPVKEFSLGMKQRLGIARAITTKPEFLMLDEPINGLDPIGIREVRNLFKILNKEYGITLLISSHILGEIEQIADTIGVINNGRLLKQVSMESIREEDSEYLEITTNNCKGAAYVLENDLGITNFRVIENNCIRIYGSSIPQSELSKTLILKDIAIDSINRKDVSLEDYFMKILNGGGISA
ncbi:ABC-2 type transport system ATP-binding protein [Anaerobacterium chartisolvens]|uniref:ABC-2 type transport system ATP-binding protein n=1 Tax=Anaerobacterium chartisolvens TaxID=1297424 RepID=A0A369BF14_9FIRM|nr:ABC transporter ATP-binding protein [Anaerobacterium chartisolvens]RCX18274.1 ABC-2 type transport system ATP-binding protein [Anaerobacterium chartisolvens]